MDLCPHLVRGQAQFVEAPVPECSAPDDAMIAELLEWIESRLDRARALLEAGTLSVEDIAVACGCASAAALRHQFTRLRGTGPSAYRRAFSEAGAPGNDRSGHRVGPEKGVRGIAPGLFWGCSLIRTARRGGTVGGVEKQPRYCAAS
ncbi:helix-turn-helix domain-containing protein [Amycolatopsis cihanbeyliensis]|uniref:helix-turn-helix domain-containing protein n=1 Tax=Amycolatopsis cihanbeyliensis TaxID=1128664 RepID=UPI0011545772|nr:helix-turn-helix domain-containing protein [Amycolatopsis cihanbeyliensis]